jgi:hypothetical protein
MLCNGCKYKAIVDILAETMPDVRDAIERNNLGVVKADLQQIYKRSKF